MPPRHRERRFHEGVLALLALGLARLGVLRACDALLDLAANELTAVRFVALMAAADAVFLFHPCRTLIRAGARLYAGRCLRAGQRRKVKFRRPAVRFNLLAVQIPIAVFVRAVQLPLQIRIALAQLIGGAVVDAMALKIAFPRLGQSVVDCLCPGNLRLRGFKHLGNVAAQLARQLDHATRLQILECSLDLLCGSSGVLSGQTAAAACHGVGPVQDQRLDGRIKVGIEHNTGRGLAVEQRQRVPPAVSCKE